MQYKHKKNLFSILIVIMISLFIQSEESTGHAKVIIYRPSFIKGILAESIICFNHWEVIRLKNESYTEVFVEPGKYAVYLNNTMLGSGGSAVSKKITTISLWNVIKLEVESGKTYYLHIDYIPLNIEIKQTPEGAALKELPKLKHLESYWEQFNG